MKHYQSAILAAAICAVCGLSACNDEAAGHFEGDYRLRINGEYCSSDSNCISKDCVNGVCKGQIGDECVLGNKACLSNYCKDEVCAENIGGSVCDPACGDGEICSNGVCKVRNGRECRENSNCYSNHCESGLCKGERGDECELGNKACLSDYCDTQAQTCADKCDPACTEGQTCIQGVCKGKNGYACNGNENCLDEQCIGNVCLGNEGQECEAEAANADITACVSTVHCDKNSAVCVECLVDEQCSNDKVCSSEHKCANKCSENEDCGEREICSDGACVEAPCTTDSDCEATKRCDTKSGKCRLKNGESCVSDGVCYSEQCLTDEKTSAKVCKGNVGDECENGEIACILSCKVVEPASDSVCYDPNACSPACGPNQVCTGGVCKGKNGEKCSDDNGCLNGNCKTAENSEQKICLGKASQECELEKSGAAEQACIAGLLCDVSAQDAVCRECVSNSDCGSKQKCDNYVCVQECEVDADCKSDYLICSENKLCVEKPCESDSDCSDNKRCDVKNKQCKFKNGEDCVSNADCYDDFCSTEDNKCKGDTGDECAHGNDACKSELCGGDKTCKIPNGEDCKDFKSSDCYSEFCSPLTDKCDDKPECLPDNDTCEKPARCAETNEKKYACATTPAIIIDDAPSTNETVTIPVKQENGSIVYVTGYKTSENDTQINEGETIAAEKVCMHLSMAPESDVTIGCEISNKTEGTCKSVTFTPENYAETQCMDVWGLDDDFVDGDQTYDVTLTADSEDALFKGLKSDDKFYFTNVDDDTGEVKVTEPGTDTPVEAIDITITNNNCNEKDSDPTAAAECKARKVKANEPETFDVKLSGKPVCGEDVEVVVSIDPNEKNIELGSSDKMTKGSSITLTFTCENWDKPQTVLIVGTPQTTLTDPEKPIDITVTTKPSQGSPYPESKEVVPVSVHEMRFAFNYINATDCEFSQLDLEPGVYKLQVWGASGGDASTINKKNSDEPDADCTPKALSHNCSHYNGGGAKTVECDSDTGFCYLDFNNKPIKYSRGGLGGYSVGTLTVTEMTKIFVTVGVEGQRVNINERAHTHCGQGGRGLTAVSSGINWFGYNGGGASDIRIGENDVYHRVIVAGGGGGADNSGESKEKADGTLYTDDSEAGGGNDGAGGYGGGEVGGRSKACTSSKCSYELGYEGATQVSGFLGGAFGDGMSVGQDGGTNDEFGGGGGGWYGGLSKPKVDGTNNNVGGSGGSGFVFTANSAEAIASVEKNFNKAYALDAKYQLTDAASFAGNTEFPTTANDGTKETGHKLDGYAIVTRLK